MEISNLTAVEGGELWKFQKISNKRGCPLWKISENTLFERQNKKQPKATFLQKDFGDTRRNEGREEDEKKGRRGKK